MTSPDNDIQIARDVGTLMADMRTVKHDMANISSKLDAIDRRMNSSDVQKARGLGFFAGAAFIITSAGAVLVAIAKLLWGGMS